MFPEGTNPAPSQRMARYRCAPRQAFRTTRARVPPSSGALPQNRTSTFGLVLDQPLTPTWRTRHPHRGVRGGAPRLAGPRRTGACQARRPRGRRAMPRTLRHGGEGPLALGKSPGLPHLIPQAGTGRLTQAPGQVAHKGTWWVGGPHNSMTVHEASIIELWASSSPLRTTPEPMPVGCLAAVAAASKPSRERGVCPSLRQGTLIVIVLNVKHILFL